LSSCEKGFKAANNPYGFYSNAKKLTEFTLNFEDKVFWFLSLSSGEYFSTLILHP